MDTLLFETKIALTILTRDQGSIFILVLILIINRTQVTNLQNEDRDNIFPNRSPLSRRCKNPSPEHRW